MEKTPIIVCRCEDVTDGEIASAVGEGARTLNDVKRRTRAGMGMCQGRWCSHAIAARIAEQSGQPLAALAPLSARPPVEPVALGVLADMGE